MSHTSTPPATEAAGPRGSLSLLDVIAQSVGFLGPVFSVSLLLPMLVGITTATGKGAGAAAPLAVLLATAGMLGVGWIVSAYARRVHAAGSLYNYVTEGLGARVGAAGGYVYYLGVLILGAGIAVLIGGTLHDDLQAEFGFRAIPTLAWQLVFLAVLVAIIHFGVQISVKAQLVLALISLAVLTVFFVYIIAKVGHGNSLAGFKPSSAGKQGWGGIAFSVIYGVLLFTGFEAAANLAEETAAPKRSIPRAVLISLLASAAFFLLGSYAQIAGFHFNVAAVAQNAGAPIAALAAPGAYGSTWMVRVVDLVILFDMLAVYIGIGVSTTRGLHTMARDGWLPKPLTRLHARRGTPVGGTVLVAVGLLVCVLASEVFPKAVAVPGLPDYFAWYSWMSGFGIFCLASIYLAMCVGAPRGLRGHGRPAPVWLAAVVGVVITGGALFGSIYKVPAPTVWSAYAALAWIVISLVVGHLVKPAPRGAAAAAEDIALPV